MPAFDTLPLRFAPGGAQTRDLRRRRDAGEFGHWPRALPFIISLLMLLIGGGIWFGGLTMINTMGAPPAFKTAWLGFGFVAALLLGLTLRNYLRTHLNWMRLVRFADVNGFYYTHQASGSDYPGLLFDQPGGRTTAHIWSTEGVFAGAGGYQYSTGSGDNQTTKHWNFVAFRLPHPVPHILLDSKQNNRSDSLPADFAGSQRLSFGEPFDSHFQVFAPTGYGADAFQLLPPDLLELLLATSGEFDYELVDSWLLCYTGAEMELDRPVIWDKIGKLGDTVVARLVRNVELYRDRHGTPSVAPAAGTSDGVARALGPIQPAGRRLQASSPWPKFVAIALGGGLLMWLFSLFADDLVRLLSSITG